MSAPEWTSVRGLTLADFPRLVDQFDSKRNGGADPASIKAGSTKPVWWTCPEGADHRWQDTPNHRTGRQRVGCPYCAGQRASVTNSVASLYPQLAAEWHPSKNRPLTPDAITYGSERKVWWRCSRGHTWDQSPNNRTNKGVTGCPMCSGHRPSRENSLAARRPDLAAELHPTLNGTLTAHQIVAGTGRQLWWKCSQGHEWRTTGASRVNAGTGCPFCAPCGSSACPPEKSVAVLAPNLLSEWHPIKNTEGAGPTATRASSERVVWWLCEHGHEWQASLANRVDRPGHPGTGCPVCSRRGSKTEVALRNILQPALCQHEGGCTGPPRPKGRLAHADITVPCLSLAIEFDGSYWHREEKHRGRDIAKTDALTAAGWVVLRIREKPLNAVGAWDVTAEPLLPAEDLALLVARRVLQMHNAGTVTCPAATLIRLQALAHTDLAQAHGGPAASPAKHSPRPPWVDSLEGRPVCTVDLDGTLYDAMACHGHKGNFRSSGGCTHVRADTLAIVADVCQRTGAVPVVLSWRAGLYDVSRTWCDEIGLGQAAILVPGGPDTPIYRSGAGSGQVAFKRGIVDALAAMGVTVVASFDDNAEVCAALGGAGIPEIHHVPHLVKIQPHEWAAGRIGAPKRPAATNRHGRYSPVRAAAGQPKLFDAVAADDGWDPGWGTDPYDPSYDPGDDFSDFDIELAPPTELHRAGDDHRWFAAGA